MSVPEASGTTLTPYMARIAEVALLSPEQEIDLAKRARAGDLAAELIEAAAALPVRRRRELERVVAEGRRATDLLVRANLRLVVSMARRYRGRGLDLPDLIQEGNLGLMKAVDRFDHARGFRFSTYAAWWIRQAMTRGLADRGRPVRVPVHVHEMLVKLRWLELELWQRHQREPTEEELAERLGLDLGRLREIRAAGQDATSLDASVNGDGETSLGSLVADPQARDPELTAAANDARAVVTDALNRLDPREQHVLHRRYGLLDGQPSTLDEVGREIGVTRERVRQIELRALRKLAHRHLDGLLDGLSG